MARYTTMRVGGPSDYFVEAKTQVQAKEACEWAVGEKLPIFVLGEGSNIVVGDHSLHMLVLKMGIRGVEKVAEDAHSITLEIGAGEHWDDVVLRSVKLGLSGIEAMSMIPGTAGAAPVQNAGAYGQEIADTLVSVTALDLQGMRFAAIPKADCGFEYRTSMFKTEAAGRYVITSITLKLSKRPPAEPTYESLKRYFSEKGITHPDLEQIRDGVMAVRSRILPDPSVVPNTGSFFKNPIVGREKLADLEKIYHDVPSYKYGDQYKLAAGWIVEQCGFKGTEHFGFVMWPNHALVITNPNRGAYGDLMRLVDLITDAVQKKFGLALEPEPQFVR